MGSSPEFAPEALVAGNTPALLWRLLPDPAPEEWGAAVEACVDLLPGGRQAWQEGGWARLAAHVLAEGQFGPDHWRLSAGQGLYYALRRLVPATVRRALRRAAYTRQRSAAALGWPIEDRYVRFQFATVRHLLRSQGRCSAPFVWFWPEAAEYALVLTHDVESGRGQRFVRELAALDERLGLRSSFNFVPESYPLDRGLLGELRGRGFEVGVHGLRHDGRLFASEAGFRARARRVNRYLKEWQAAGFRAPMTHRHPGWMQALDVAYDLSFFDTDPLETIAGGTMSIWPFFMGRFVELPYTLPQDHVVLHTLGERTPSTWLEKLDFLARHGGMALLNAHPDYLEHPEHLRVYERFLREVQRRGGYWNALPRDVARWWRARARSRAASGDGRWQVEGLPGATVGTVLLTGERVSLSREPLAEAGRLVR